MDFVRDTPSAGDGLRARSESAASLGSAQFITVKTSVPVRPTPQSIETGLITKAPANIAQELLKADQDYGDGIFIREPDFILEALRDYTKNRLYITREKRSERLSVCSKCSIGYEPGRVAVHRMASSKGGEEADLDAAEASYLGATSWIQDILQGIRLWLRADIDGSIEELAAWRVHDIFCGNSTAT